MIHQYRIFKSKIAFILICLIIFSISLSIFPSFNKIDKDNLLNKERFYKVTPRISQTSGKILIDNNWLDAVDAGIFTGSGTFSDPFVIQDLILIGNGTGTGISIGNSKNVYFRIENCIILNFTYGIRLAISCNGTLLNNNCSNNEIGIYLDGWIDIPNPTPDMVAQCYCMNNTVSNNFVSNNEDYGIYCRGGFGEKHLENNTIKENLINNNRYGIYFLAFCNNNSILDNILINNEAPGIFLEGPCYDNHFMGNLMRGCGFYSHYSQFSSNTIDTTNLVNDGHLYFYANSTGLNNDDFSNAGQIMLFNCNNSIISNLDLSNGSVSISLIECNNMEINYNNLSSNNMWGLELSNCDKISIIGNVINENHDGIEGGLTNSIIVENDINKNYMDGIAIGGHNNLIIRNNIKNNGYRGLDIRFFCENNTILDNNIENNVLGAFLVNSFSNISENVISGNIDTGLYLGGGSNNNTIFLNFFRNNSVHIDDNGLNNRWNNSEIGNYWDNYTGIDANGDGIGDIPHNISSSPLVQDYLPIVDNDVPEVTILSPSNNSVFKNTAPSFTISVKEKHIDEMWYTLDGGLHNYTFIANTTINQAAWNLLPSASVKLEFYIRDKTGKIGFVEVIIIKKGRIYINNNWPDARDADICTGSGTFADPYIIQDLIIDGNGTGNGIAIRSRNEYFRIENCTIFNCEVGISLYSTDNGTLFNNNCSFNSIGIYLHCPTMPTPETYGCFNNQIIGNIANNNSWQGIYLDQFCEDTNVINNTVNNNVLYGINFEGHPEIKISNNTANNNNIGINIWGKGNQSELSQNKLSCNQEYGIYLLGTGWILTENNMYGSGLGFPLGGATFSMNIIENSNNVNGGPIYLYVNKTNLKPNDFSIAGQIILVNCTNSLIKDVNVSYSSIGISLYDSNNITVLNSISSNNYYGLILRNTNNSYLVGNIFKKNKAGNRMGGLNNKITRNYFSSYNYHGTGLEFSFFSNNNTISDNEFINNYWGLRLILSSYNIISGNILKENIYGIGLMTGSEYNRFNENFFIGNMEHVEGGGIHNDWNNTVIGNYWDNYTGNDGDDDGIGDIPHNITQSPLRQDFLPIVDNQAPNITIFSPKNNTTFGDQAPSFNIFISERFLHKMWYTLDNGLHNYTLISNGTISQTAWNMVDEGTVILKIYAMDKTGKIGFAEVIIIKEIQKAEKIPGYDILIIINIISMISVILVKLRNKKHKNSV